MFQLSKDHGVSLNGIRLPTAAIEEEVNLRRDQLGLSSSPRPATWTSSFTAAVGSYYPFSSISSASTSTSVLPPKGYWGKSMDDLVDECGGVPPMLQDLREAMMSGCLAEEGIFRRTPGVRAGPNTRELLADWQTHLRSVLVNLLDLPISSQPDIPWHGIARLDPLLPPKLVSMLLSHSSSPMIRQDQYRLIRRCETAEKQVDPDDL
jgi:hypothetical protein